MADEKKKPAGLTDEQKQLLADLLAVKAATEPAKQVCPGCGSDLHVHCALPAHHGGRSEARG